LIKKSIGFLLLILISNVAIAQSDQCISADVQKTLEDPEFGLSAISFTILGMVNFIKNIVYPDIADIKTHSVEQSDKIDKLTLEIGNLERKVTASDKKIDILLQRLSQQCQDNNLDPGETCDDGNNLNGDGCDENCQLEKCGNAIVQIKEECDDGNNIANDGCNNCKLNVCGDGVIWTGIEECEEDSDCGSGRVCSSCKCVAKPSVCGNKRIETGESCELDNSWGETHQFKCNGYTYEECDPVKCQYVQTNVCSKRCGSSSYCDGAATDSYLNDCRYGASYLQDYCDSKCMAHDSICKSAYPICTAHEACDGKMPGEGICNSQCKVI
jgi:cysteine-rich repeat protein